MKHKILSVIGAGLLMISAWSCREQSDALTAYDQNETLVFAAADTTFVGKFDVLWNGMNQYYALWDYEAEQGIDWDAVYNEFRPQFEALDQRETVTDDELLALMQKILSPLHDGHLHFDIKNHKTGSSLIYSPNQGRVMQRPDFKELECTPSLAYYTNVANGEVETDTDGNPIAKECSTSFFDFITRFMQTPGEGGLWISDRYQELMALSEPTEMQTFEIEQLKNLMTSLKQIEGKPTSDAIAIWNTLQTEYSFLNIPGFNYFDPSFDDASIDVKFALLKGNIAYFRLSIFTLTCYLDDKEVQKKFNMSNPTTQLYVKQVREVWQSWFDTVQNLHKNGTLGGVIIDVRSNGGGNMLDSKYIVGSLVPAGGIFFGYQRFKRGTGRYDYSPLMPARVLSMEDPHETITEPIVILTNCRSVSMSETSALCIKALPNGTQIGKRSWGALCALTDNDAHSYNYAGYIGVKGVTSVFGNVPSMASYTLDKQLIEAEGITPDIDVDLDIDLFKATGRDTQLDRALQFIRTGI